MFLQKWRLKLTPFPHLKRNAFLNTVIDLALMLLMEHCSFIYCIIKITEVTHSPLFHIKGWIKGVKLILNIHTHTHTFFSCMCCLVLQVIKIFLWFDFLMFRKEFFNQILALLFGWKYRKGHSYKWLYHKSYILKVNNLIYIVLLSTRICFDKTVFTWINCTASVWFPR